MPSASFDNITPYPSLCPSHLVRLFIGPPSWAELLVTRPTVRVAFPLPPYPRYLGGVFVSNDGRV